MVFYSVPSGIFNLRTDDSLETVMRKKNHLLSKFAKVIVLLLFCYKLYTCIPVKVMTKVYQRKVS